jgi:hypothetical protein
VLRSCGCRRPWRADEGLSEHVWTRKLGIATQSYPPSDEEVDSRYFEVEIKTSLALGNSPCHVPVISYGTLEARRSRPQWSAGSGSVRRRLPHRSSCPANCRQKVRTTRMDYSIPLHAITIEIPDTIRPRGATFPLLSLESRASPAFTFARPSDHRKSAAHFCVQRRRTDSAKCEVWRHEVRDVRMHCAPRTPHDQLLIPVGVGGPERVPLGRR